MTMSLDVPRMECTYLNLLVSLEHRLTVSDFNCRNKALTAKLLKEDYRYHKLRKTFSKFYRRQSGLVDKYNIILKKLLQQHEQGISEPGPRITVDFNSYVFA